MTFGRLTVLNTFSTENTIIKMWPNYKSLGNCMAKLNSHPSLMFILIDPLEIKAPLVVALICNLAPKGRSRTANEAQV